MKEVLMKRSSSVEKFNLKNGVSRGRRQLRSRRLFAAIERLEPRTLLSVMIVNPKTATYTDADGDKVTVSVSLGTLMSGNFTTAASGLGDQLQTIDLSAGGFDGANLTISVVRSATSNGDGLANVG